MWTACLFDMTGICSFGSINTNLCLYAAVFKTFDEFIIFVVSWLIYFSAAKLQETLFLLFDKVEPLQFSSKGLNILSKRPN